MLANQILSSQYMYYTVYLALIPYPYMEYAQDPYIVFTCTIKVLFRCTAFLCLFYKMSIETVTLEKLCAWYPAWTFTCWRKFAKIYSTSDSSNFCENFSFILVNISVKIDRSSEFRNLSNKLTYYWKILSFRENDINYPRSTRLPPPPPKKRGRSKHCSTWEGWEGRAGRAWLLDIAWCVIV